MLSKTDRQVVTAAEVLRPIRVALAEDHEIVRLGLSSMLASYPTTVELVDHVRVGPEVDVLLFDPFLRQSPSVRSPVRSLPLTPSTTKRIAYTWERDPRTVVAVQSAGIQEYLFKGAPAAEVLSSITSAHRADLTAVFEATTLIRTNGLTPREAEVLALIAQGMSNQQIATALTLSTNSVKTYIRNCYYKIEVESRSQAVIWAFNRYPNGIPETEPDVIPGQPAATGTHRGAEGGHFRLTTPASEQLEEV